jgi:hypothetical protein
VLIEFLEKPIRINGKEPVKDFRLNIAENHQMRCKMVWIGNEPEAPPVPIDIVVYEWTIPRLEKFTLSISIDGLEMVSKQRFNFKLQYDFMHKNWRLRGTINDRSVEKTMHSIVEVITIGEYFAVQ